MKGAIQVFNVITIIFALILIFWLTQLNYNNLSFQENRNAYFGMLSVLLMMLAIQLIKRGINKKNKS